MLFQRSPKLICNAAFFLKYNLNNYSFITLEKLNILLKYSLNKWIVLKYHIKKKLELSSCYHDVAAFLPSWLPNVVLRFKIWGNLRDEAFTFQNNISRPRRLSCNIHKNCSFFLLVKGARIHASILAIWNEFSTLNLESCDLISLVRINIRSCTCAICLLH